MSWTVTDQPIARAHDTLVAQLEPVIHARGEAVLAVPGGSTPGPVLHALRDGDPDLLAALTVTLVDERHVSIPREPTADDWRHLPPDSNTRLLYAELIEAAPVRPRVLGWALPGALEPTRAHLAATVPDPDVLLLGMGPDGHIASLFPGHPALASTERVIALTDSPKPPPTRLSMSLALLNRARAAVIVVRGAAKAPAVERALAGDPALPTTHLTGPELFWVIDHDAAGVTIPSGTGPDRQESP